MSGLTDTLETVRSATQSGYKWGFETNIEMELAPKGLDETIIRLISARKAEPERLLAWRLTVYTC
jgi:Fe-S cluster assembly protein SufB